jgi:hypothetical protein
VRLWAFVSGMIASLIGDRRAELVEEAGEFLEIVHRIKERI